MSLVRLRPVWTTNHPPSVLWHCWLGHQTCKKNHRPYNLYCVCADVKPCSINQPLNHALVSFVLVCVYVGSFRWWFFCVVLGCRVFSFERFAPVKRLAVKIVSEITHDVLSGTWNHITLNSTQHSLSESTAWPTSSDCIVTEPRHDWVVRLVVGWRSMPIRRRR